MQALLDYTGQPWQRWPEQGPTWRALAMAARLGRAKRRGAVRRFGGMSPLDEYPAVPYYSLDGKTFYYDSTSLALHLDAQRPGEEPLVPAEPALAFLCRYIDEAFDEFGPVHGAPHALGRFRPQHAHG